MKKPISILIIFFMACLYSCNKRRNDINKLNFNDKSIEVQDSLLKMEKILKELPQNVKNLNTNYEYRNNIIVNNIPGRDSDSARIYSDKALNTLGAKEEAEFISLAKYLKKNYITAGYINQQLDICLFEYHYLPSNTFNDLREIAVLQNSDTLIFHKQYKILDNYNFLYLISPIDARIR